MFVKASWILPVAIAMSMASFSLAFHGGGLGDGGVDVFGVFQDAFQKIQQSAHEVIAGKVDKIVEGGKGLSQNIRNKYPSKGQKVEETPNAPTVDGFGLDFEQTVDGIMGKGSGNINDTKVEHEKILSNKPISDGPSAPATGGILDLINKISSKQKMYDDQKTEIKNSNMTAKEKDDKITQIDEDSKVILGHWQKELSKILPKEEECVNCPGSSKNKEADTESTGPKKLSNFERKKDLINKFLDLTHGIKDNIGHKIQKTASSKKKLIDLIREHNQ